MKQQLFGIDKEKFQEGVSLMLMEDDSLLEHFIDCLVPLQGCTCDHTACSCRPLEYDVEETGSLEQLTPLPGQNTVKKTVFVTDKQVLRDLEIATSALEKIAQQGVFQEWSKNTGERTNTYMDIARTALSKIKGEWKSAPITFCHHDAMGNCNSHGDGIKCSCSCHFKPEECKHGKDWESTYDMGYKQGQQDQKKIDAEIARTTDFDRFTEQDGVQVRTTYHGCDEIGKAIETQSL